MRGFWDRIALNEADWIKVVLTKLPCNAGSIYRLDVHDNWTGQTISQHDYSKVGEAVEAFEALCVARELLQAEAVS